MTTENTRGLLAMLSQALSKSKEPSKSDNEPVELQAPLPEPDAGATPAIAGSPDEATDAMDANAPAPASAEVAGSTSTAEEPASDPEPTLPPRPASSYKVSLDEARDIVLRGLQRLPDFPSQGVTVTLYGSRPWNAMLTFAPGSTSHRNATSFRHALTDMVAELRKQIEIDHAD